MPHNTAVTYDSRLGCSEVATILNSNAAARGRNCGKCLFGGTGGDLYWGLNGGNAQNILRWRPCESANPWLAVELSAWFARTGQKKGKDPPVGAAPSVRLDFSPPWPP